MENTTDTPTEAVAPPSPGPAAVLHRPREGRFVAGVAAGIADRLGVPRWAVRLAFLLIVFGGGAGFLLYVAGWLLIPAEGEPESVGQKWAKQANSTQPWIGIALIVGAAAILFSSLPFLDGGLLFPTALLVIGVLLYRGDLPGFNPRASRKDRTGNSQGMASSQGPRSATTEGDPTMTTFTEPNFATTAQPVVVKPRTPPSPLGRITIGAAVAANGVLAVADRLWDGIDAGLLHYLALTVAVLGLGILVGTFYGKARWLIPFGLLLLPPMVAASFAESIDGDWQTPQVIRPNDFASIAPAYERGAGELVIDLTNLSWNGETVDIRAEVGAGRLELLIPAGVTVEATAEVGIGDLDTPTFDQGGLGVDRRFTLEGDGVGTVLATLDVGVGELVIDVAGDELFDGQTGEPFFGDLVADVNSIEALEDSYVTTDGDITLDLTDLVLIGDRSVEVITDLGDIVVILPVETSYRIQARTDTGVVDLFGEDRVDRGGVVRADSIITGPVIELIIQTSEGDINLTNGERS